MLDAPVFKAVVGASIVTAKGKVDFTVHDWTGVDGKHYMMVTYANEKTKENGTADETSITGSSVNADGCSYGGNMLIGKQSVKFGLTLQKGSTVPGTVSFFANTKAGINISGVLSSADFYLVP